MTVGSSVRTSRRTRESRAPTQPRAARIVLSRVPLSLVFGCILAAPFWNAGAQSIPRPFDITSDVNPALSHATGFALADGAPALFRAFAPRGRHVMMLYPARMATSEGFVAAQYVYNSRNLAVNYVSGGSESWMVSATGGGTHADGTESRTIDAPDAKLEFDRTDARSAFDVSARVMRMLPINIEGWRAAVGLRAAVEHSDNDIEINELSTLYDTLAAIPRYRRIVDTRQSQSINDRTAILGGLEVGLSSARTDFALAVHIESTDSEMALDDFSDRLSTDSTILDDATLYQVVSDQFELHRTGSDRRTRYSAGFSMQSVLGNRRSARHMIVLQGGAAGTIGESDDMSFRRDERVTTFRENGTLVDIDAVADSTRSETLVDPLERDVFAAAAYVHQQWRGRALITAGIGAESLFRLFRYEYGSEIDASTGSERSTRNTIAALIPVFVDLNVTRSLGLFAGFIYAFSYDWGRSSIDGGPPTNNDYASRFDTTDADTDYIVGASFNLDGFFGQIHFANDFTDVRQWQVTLGLDL